LSTYEYFSIFTEKKSIKNLVIWIPKITCFIPIYP